VAPGWSFRSEIKDKTYICLLRGVQNRQTLNLDGEYRREIFERRQHGRPGSCNSFQRIRTSLVRIGGIFASRETAGAGYITPAFFPLWDQNHALATNHIDTRLLPQRSNLVGRWDLQDRRALHGWLRHVLLIPGVLSADNLAGLKPQMNMMVIRTGWNFEARTRGETT